MMSPPALAAAPASVSKKHGGIPLWMFSLCMLLVVGALSAWIAYLDYRQTLEGEYRLLEVRAWQREARISGFLRSVNLVLGSVIDDLRDRPRLSTAEQNQLLRDYLRQLPELRNMLVVDAAARIRAESKETSIGGDVSGRDYFKHHRAAPGDDAFHVSRPFKALSGVNAVTVSRGMRDREGRFAGVVLASIDAAFFAEALKITVPEPGVESLLINLGGDILSIAPPIDIVGKTLIGGIAYTEHMRAGLPTTRHLNQTNVTQLVKMSVIHNLPGAPLAVIVSRNFDSVMGDWRRSMYAHAVGFLLLAATTLFFSGLAARRQRSLLRAQEQIILREARLRATVESALDGIVSIDGRGAVVGFNPAAEAIFGWKKDEILGRPMVDMIVPQQYRQAHREGFARYVQTREAHIMNQHIEITALRRGGSEFPIELALTAIRQNGEDIFTAYIRDITERKQMQDQVRELAFYDTLTHLPNRRLVNDRLTQAMASSKRSGHHGALMFLDLDNFKPINDTHGHEFGDLLLIEAAGRLKRCVREIDTVGRFGGDEFVVLIELEAGKSESTAQASAIAEKILAALSMAYVLTIEHEGDAAVTVEHHCTASIGVVLFVDHEASASDLLNRADTAMYQAKEAGRNAVRFYDGEG